MYRQLGWPTCPGAGGYDDGSANAPRGIIQHPRLLDLSASTNEAGVALAVRPPFAVAGVDYAVGPNLGTTYKDISNAGVQSGLPTGASWDGTNKLIHVDGSVDVTLDSYDLTNGTAGAGIYVAGTFTANVTVTNCKYKGGTSSVPFVQGAVPTGASGKLTVKYNDVDGNFVLLAQAYLVVWYGLGGLDCRYNWPRNTVSDCFDYYCVGNPLLAPTIRYNLFEAIGLDYLAHTDACAFGNYAGTQGLAGTADFDNISVSGNTFYQPAPSAGLPCILSSMMNLGDIQGKTWNNPSFDHNTAVMIGATGHRGADNLTTHPAASNMTQFATVNAPLYGFIVGATVTDNYAYCDTGGGHDGAYQYGFDNTAFYPTGGTNQHTSANNYARNYAMKTGAVMDVPPT